MIWRRLIRPLGRDRYRINLPPALRELLPVVAGELDVLLDTDDPSLRRLFPTAYAQDPERDAEYQLLARDRLVDRRRAAIADLIATADADEVTGSQLAAWMTVINDLRLVLGTQLDVSEDDQDTDPDSPQAPAMELYRLLGYLLEEIVEALNG
jgi:hypothetical protein